LSIDALCEGAEGNNVRFPACQPDGLGEVAVPIGAGSVEDEDFGEGHKEYWEIGDWIITYHPLNISATSLFPRLRIKVAEIKEMRKTHFVLHGKNLFEVG
jgi:hypothetical protein